MDAVIGRFSAHVFALFRIMVGLLFACHGAQKLLGWPHPTPLGAAGRPLPPMMLVSGIIELGGGLLVAVGLFAGIAAFICSGEMAVAFFTVHFHATSDGWIPLINKGELAVAYCFSFLYIAAHGSGIWSIDNLLRRRVAINGSTAAAQP
jgi:putative oxidoreductase